MRMEITEFIHSVEVLLENIEVDQACE
jgi:hypothetical protein